MDWVRVLSKQIASLFYEHESSSTRDLFIHSTQRSGSTLLFDLFAGQPRSKAVGEPFQERKHPTVGRFVSEVRSRYVRFSGETGSEVKRYFDALLSGDFVDGFERSYNPRSVRHHRRTDHNVVKILRALPCTAWFQKTYPEADHLILLRHPVPTVNSRSRNGWYAPVSDFINDHIWYGQLSAEQKRLISQLYHGDLWDQHLAVWICEHQFIEEGRREIGDLGGTILAFEHLVRRKEEAAAWLAEWLSLPDENAARRQLSVPSRSSRHSTPLALSAIKENQTSTILGGWQDSLDPERRAKVQVALETFGLSMYSADDPLPGSWLCDPVWA